MSIYLPGVSMHLVGNDEIRRLTQKVPTHARKDNFSNRTVCDGDRDGDFLAAPGHESAANCKACLAIQVRTSALDEQFRKDIAKYDKYILGAKK